MKLTIDYRLVDIKATRFLNALKQLGEEGKPIRQKIMKSASILMKQNILDHFKQGVDSKGRKWQPLSSKYKRWKERHYPNRPTLIRTRRLYNSFNISSTPNQAKVYTGVKYGVYHQMGTSRTPKREFMYLDKVAQEKILKMIYDKQEEILSQGSDI